MINSVDFTLEQSNYFNRGFSSEIEQPDQPATSRPLLEYQLYNELRDYDKKRTTFGIDLTLNDEIRG
jgi:hypothetical protein